MNSAPYAPAPYPAAPAPAPPAIDARRLVESPAIRLWLKSQIYERAGTLDEILADLAVIHAVRNRGKARSGLYLLALLLSLGLGVWVAMAVRNPVPIGAGIVAAIVIGVFWGKEPSFEPRRVDLVIGLLGRLAIPPGTRVGVRMDLTPLDSGRKRTASNYEAGWSVNYHRDEWLAIEGTLEGGVGFRYTRNESRRTAVHSSVSGNVRTTRTRIQGWFDDGFQLRYPPEKYPRAAALGPGALKGLKFPEGFEPKDFVNQPGTLNLLIGSDRKWDAGPPGVRLDGGDGVKIAGLWLSILFELLGAGATPMDLDGPGRPPLALSLPAIDGDTVKAIALHPVTPALALGLPALFLILGGVDSFRRASSIADEADSYDRRAKTAKDAKQKQDHQRWAKSARERSDSRTIEGGIYLGVGIVALAAAGAGIALTLRRRRKLAAAAAAPPANPAQLPPGAWPPQWQGMSPPGPPG